MKSRMKTFFLGGLYMNGPQPAGCLIDLTEAVHWIHGTLYTAISLCKCLPRLHDLT